MLYLWFIAALTAYFIKGLCGFANTLVFTSILSFGTANANITPIDALTGYPTNLILAWKNRKNLDPKVYIPLMCFVLAGSIPGVFLLKNVNAGAVKLVFGIVVVILGAEMLFREYSRKSSNTSKALLAVIGILSGLLCGLFGVGALLAAYVSRVTKDSDSFKANISIVFIIDNTVRLVLYGTLHMITADTVKMSLILIPFVLSGLFLGIKCSNRLNEENVRKLTAALLIISGISLILKNIGS